MTVDSPSGGHSAARDDARTQRPRSTPRTFAVRAAGALLRLYPAAFQERYREPVLGLLEQLDAERQSRTPFARLRFSVWALSDVVKTGGRLWLRRGLERFRRRTDRPIVKRRRGASAMDSLRQDLLAALRNLKRRPGATAIVVLSLAFGIGATTTLYTMVDGLLRRPLPVEGGDRLVRFLRVTPDGVERSFSYPDFRDLAEQSVTLDGVVAHRLETFALHRSGDAERDRSELLFGEVTSGNYFDLLGVEMSLGRAYSADEATAEAPTTVVLSHYFWQHSLGADPEIIGTTVELNGVEATVTAVAAPEFKGTKFGLAMDAWTPMETFYRDYVGPDWGDDRGNRRYPLLARLTAGTSVTEASQEAATIGSRLAAAYPDDYRGVSLTVLPERAGEIAAENPQILSAIQAAALCAAALVLLIACANIANLVLSSGIARQRELLTRRALGAGRGRVMRLLLVEGLLLAGSGGLLAFALGSMAPTLVERLIPPLPYRMQLDIEPNFETVVVIAVVSLGSVLLFSWLPSLKASRQEPSAILHLGGDRTTLRRGRLQNALVVAQVLFSTLSLVLAVVFLESLSNAQEVDPGFSARNGLMASFDLDLSGIERDAGARFYDELERRARALPGASGAALVAFPPLGDRSGETEVYATDRSYSGTDRGVSSVRNVVSASFLDTFGVRVVAGRGFTAEDDREAPRRLLINETLASRLWPDRNAVGQQLRSSPDSESTWEVIGVVENGRYRFVGEPPQPAFYLPHRQVYRAAMTLLVRSDDGDPLALATPLRHLVQELDPGVPMFEVKTLRAHLTGSVWPFRLGAQLASALALLSLGLAVVGLYGVLVWTVVARRRELAVRIALGAAAAQVRRFVLTRTTLLAGSGVLLGGGLAFLLVPKLSGMLLGVGTNDPRPVLFAMGVVVGVSLLASLVPARSAARTDPAVVLRND